MKPPVSCGRLMLAAIAMLLIAACEDAGNTAAAPGSRLLALEAELQQVRSALGSAQQRLSALQSEQARAQRRMAELSASAGELEGRNRDMGQRLAHAQAQLAQSANAHQALRQQRDQHARHAHELSNEQQSLRAGLASAHNEIRQLQARQGPDRRQMADLYQRGAAAAREVQELRRYNGFLLQERSNLQAWLQEVTAARNAQREALAKAAHEAQRMQAEAAASKQELQARLDAASKQLAQLGASRDALLAKAEALRTSLARAAEAESRQATELEKALAHAASLADANARMANELQNNQTATTQSGVQRSSEAGDADVLRAELERSADKLAKLKAANDYLVDKIEACTLQQRSSRSGAGKPVQGRLRLIAVAEKADDPKGGRREKELNETKAKVRKLENEQQALVKKIETLEAENATVKKQVQTLTWANEVLVKELDAAYAGKKNASPESLPEGTRGIYTLRKGESLSRVANAFYGDPARWQDIVKANQEKIPDPDRVTAGTVILIPE